MQERFSCRLLHHKSVNQAAQRTRAMRASRSRLQMNGLNSKREQIPATRAMRLGLKCFEIPGERIIQGKHGEQKFSGCTQCGCHRVQEIGAEKKYLTRRSKDQAAFFGNRVRNVLKVLMNTVSAWIRVATQVRSRLCERNHASLQPGRVRGDFQNGHQTSYG